MRFAVSAAVLFALFHCAPSAPREAVTLPDDVAYLVVAEVDDDGTMRAASRLTEWGPSVPVVFTDRPQVRLLGFTADQLAPFGVDGRRLPEERLRPAVGCTVSLPAPRLALGHRNGDWTATSTTGLGRLTAGFLSARCSELTTMNWGVDDQCAERYCAPDIRRSGPCSVVVELDECGGGRVNVTVSPNGEICAQLEDRPLDCTAEDGAAPIGFSCEPSCRLRIYPEAADLPPPFTLTSVSITGGPPREPPLESTSDVVGLESLRSIYGQSMIGLEDRLVVSSHYGPAGTCTGESRFIFIDPETLSVRVRAAPPCTRVLEARENGFWGIHLSGGQWRLSAFDQEGTPIATVALTEDPAFADLSAWGPRNMWVSDDGSELCIVLVHEREAQLPGTVVIRRRTVDLGLIDETLIEGQSRGFGSAIVGPYLLIVSYEDRIASWRRFASAAPPVTQTINNDDFRRLLYRPYPLGPESAVLGSDGTASALLIGPNQPATRISHFGRPVPQATIAFAQWGDSDLLLAVGTRREAVGRQALAMLLDPAGQRYRPGVWLIGEGIPTDIVRRGDRHFVLLPWAGQIAVLDRANNAH